MEIYQILVGGFEPTPLKHYSSSKMGTHLQQSYHMGSILSLEQYDPIARLRSKPGIAHPTHKSWRMEVQFVLNHKPPKICQKKRSTKTKRNSLQLCFPKHDITKPSQGTLAMTIDIPDRKPDSSGCFLAQMGFQVFFFHVDVSCKNCMNQLDSSHSGFCYFCLTSNLKCEIIFLRNSSIQPMATILYNAVSYLKTYIHICRWICSYFFHFAAVKQFTQTHDIN